MLELLKAMRPDLTVHGFRSSFRDWAAEQTNHPREVAEAALAHTILTRLSGPTGVAICSSKRRRLMAEWARYCEQKPVASKSVLSSR